MNKSIFNKFICALLICAMLFSSFAVSSFAEDASAENIYYATITNPHDHEVTMPIEIKCGFEKGEVISADYVYIYDNADETQTLIPHRYEGEKNAAYFEKADLGFYDDNSLKFGSFWIIDTLKANETKTYALKISDTAHEKFTKRIAVKNNTSTTANTTVTTTFGDNTTTILFAKPVDTQNGAYHYLQASDSNFSETAVLKIGVTYILDADGNMIYPFQDSANYTMKRAWTLGDGAVYLDYTATATANDDSMRYTVKYRVFANGLVIAKNYAEALTDATLYGYGAEYTIPTKGRSVLNERTKHGYYLIGDTALKITNSSLQSSSIANKTFTTAYDGSVTKSGATSGSCVMRLNNSGYESISKGEVFYIEAAVSPSGHTDDDLMTKLSTTAYKGSTDELRVELVEKAISLLTTVYNTEIAPGDNVKPLNALNRIFAKHILEGKLASEEVDAYISLLDEFYSGCTAETFQETWESNTQGIEYIGRNTNDLYDLRFLCLKFGYTEQANRLGEIIHELADFYVWLEDYSGGVGMVYLGVNSSNKEGLNPCASAMKALYNSLRIKYDENRDTVYNRIFEKLKTGYVYDSYFLYKFTNTNAELYSQNHYHMYTSYEFSDTPAFDLFAQNYIQSTFSPSGRGRDLEYSYSSTRRGSSLNYSLAADILYKLGTPSELAQAIVIIDEISGKWNAKKLHSWPVNTGNDSRTVMFTQALINMLNTYHSEFKGYDALNITLDDEKWLETAYNGGVDFLNWNIASSNIIADTNSGNIFRATSPDAAKISYYLPTMDEYKNLFSLEFELRYTGSEHFSAVRIYDKDMENGMTDLLNVMADGTLYFTDSTGAQHIICNSIGEHLTVNKTTDGEFTKIALVVDGENNSYSIYVNNSPAFIINDSETIYATDIDLGLKYGQMLKDSTLELFADIQESSFTLDLDNLAISAIKNGLAPVIHGTQDHVNDPSLRIVATVDTLYCQSVGFIVKYGDHSVDTNGRAVYEKIIENGEDLFAQDVGGRYFALLSLVDLPENETVEIEVAPYSIFFGKRIPGEAQKFVWNQK